LRKRNKKVFLVKTYFPVRVVLDLDERYFAMFRGDRVCVLFSPPSSYRVMSLTPFPT